MTRIVSADIYDAPAAELPPLESTDSTPKHPWINRWEFERGGKRWRVAVRVFGPLEWREEMWGTDRPVLEIIDAREWIESLGDYARFPTGRQFQLVVEEVSK